MGRFHRHEDGTEHEHHDHQAPEHDHGDHTAYMTGPERVTVLERIFHENDLAAVENRSALDAAGILAFNLMSSPGAGKTSLLQKTLEKLANPDRVGIIEGDIETSIDADRLIGYGAQVSLLNTSNGFGGECHLDAPMVAHALTRLSLPGLDTLFVENVGNLVCPAEFDVGAHWSVMVYAITEGEEKPLKYPVMFRAADLVLINKMDLLPHLDFDLDLFERNLDSVNPQAKTLRISTRTGEGVDEWLTWLAALPRPGHP